MFVIMGLVYRFKALGGGFRILKFDLLYKYIYTAISIKVVGLTQAYATRPKGSVGSWKSVLVSR